MFSAVGPERRILRTWWISLPMISFIEVEEMRALPGLRRSPGGTRGASDARVIEPPAQPGNHRMHPRRGRRIAQGKIDIVGELAAHADREALFDHHDMLSRPASRSRKASVGNGRKDTMVTSPMLNAVGAHLVDGILDGAVDRAHGHHQHFRILGAIGAQQAAGIASEPLLANSAANSGISRKARAACNGQEAHFGERIRPDHGADGNRAARDRAPAPAHKAADKRRPSPGRACRRARPHG